MPFVRPPLGPGLKTLVAVALSAVLTADEVISAISLLLDDIVRLSERVRVVGTASSSLRGIVLPVADIDILARDRATVDELVAASASPPATLIETPFGR